jgi:arsenical pump membrane protein
VIAAPWSVWGIAALATAGVILRPFAWPEAIWAVTGAVLLIALKLLPAPEFDFPPAII